MWTFPSEQLCLIAFFLFFVLMLLALRFVRVAQLPDDLEMLLDEQRLGVRSASLLSRCFLWLKLFCRCSRQLFVLASPAPTAS
jgi:hypothetical protein